MSVPVMVPCSCPGTPHEQDTVNLIDKITVPMAVAAMAAMGPDTRVADMTALAAPAYFRHGIESWTFVDEDGKPLPVNPDNIDARLAWDTGGYEVADKGSELYSGDLFSPLARRLLERSRTTSTDDSTSATPASGAVIPISSKSSSPKHTAGKRSAARAR